MREEERRVLESAREVAATDDYRAWARRCEECLANLRERCRDARSRISTGARTSLVARILRLIGARDDLRRRFEREGAGVERREDVEEPREGFSWSEIETAFKRRVLTGAVINRYYIEPLRFLEDARDTVLRRVRDVMGRYRSVKVNTVFNGEFVSGDKIAVKTIATRNHPLLPTTDLREWYDARVIDDIIASLEEFQERDSGWALSRILDLTVNVNRYNPMRAGCYVRVPREIQIKRAVVNVRSDDEACFAWSVVAALYPVERHGDRSSRYPDYSTVLNLEGSKLPMTLSGIGRFERLNDISVNVYTVGERRRGKGGGIRIVPLRLTDRKRERHANLLYLSEATRGDNEVGHFACIRDLSRLVGSQLGKRQHRKHVCDRCMHYFHSSEKLSAHSEDCGRLNDCAIVLPDKDDRWLTFDHHSRKERVPFVVYADLECALERKEGDEGRRTAKTAIVHHHRAHSAAYYARCSFDDAASAYGSYRGEDCVAWFVRELRDLALRAKAALDVAVPMTDLTSDERERFASAPRCHACERPFEAGDVRVRDHCHLTGRFRGPAHSACNLNYKDSYVIPVFFHNLSGYDAHFIIKDVANAYPGSVELLPVTKESYIAFSKTVRDTAATAGGNEEGAARSRCVKLRFVDSFKFLGASLEKLASYLDESKLTIARGEFRDLADEDFRLLTRKGVFPYEYVDSVERLRETRLPPREAFHSSLTGDTVSESDYAHATRVWERFSVETLGDYSDLYLKTDVLLLADVFENFRAACLESYGLDPAYYFTLPGYTWDAMLKHTGVRFELLTDIDMMMFVERGIRGGLSQCSNRYARANKYMSAHDPSRPSIYLMYLDVNNLYGWAMCQPLPYERFEWVDDLESLDVMSVAEDSAVGYILEVDLDYPADSHDAHADLPFCPTRDKPPGKRQSKLLATLYDKRRYVTHYRNLQQCVRHGLRLTRIHRALRFSQSPWLRGYVELNTRLRANASNDFEKNLYKLMNNAVFGKTMENVRNRVDVRLATRWDGRFGAEALISKPNFHSRSVFSENLMAVELRKLEAKIDKPIYVGMSILDISKIHLYAFHYEYMLPLYRDKCKILYTDTDSLIYRVECEDVYENVKRDIDRFDTSDYAVDNPYGVPRANKKVLGLMKDENNGALMLEFVGLRAKMYALRVEGRDDTKKSKGVKSSVVARTLTFDDYARCLRREIEMTREQSCLRSKLHEVYTVRESKVALSPYDDKRYIVPDSTDTLPWGHYKIPL